MVSAWKHSQIFALACLAAFAPWLIAAFAPWLIGRTFDPEFLVVSAVVAGLFIAVLVGVAALVKSGVGLFRSM